METNTENALSIGPQQVLTAAQQAELFEQFRNAIRPPPAAPADALKLLHETACADTGGSQAARSFLFWLAGLPDPTGFQGSGGLELRRMDHERKDAALEVLRWWSGPTKSDEPLFELLQSLQDRFTPANDVSERETR